MNRSACRAAALCAALLLGGCEYQIPYHESEETFTVDPVTGHMLRTTLWRNSGGGQATTVDDITANGVEVRRGAPPPTRGIIGIL